MRAVVTGRSEGISPDSQAVLHVSHQKMYLPGRELGVPESIVLGPDTIAHK